MAQAALAPSVDTGSRLVCVDGRTLPLRDVRIDVDARCGLAGVRLEQRFHNPYDEPLEVSYRLPLPADGAVVAFGFLVGEKRITGEIDRRDRARERFAEALIEGRTAALLEQERSNLFTQKLGNIPPGAEIVATLQIEQPLAWHAGGWQWRFPTVVAPRFGESPEVAVEVAQGPTGVSAAVSITIGDAMTGPAGSPSHVLDGAGGHLHLAGGASLDRDIVVNWPVGAPQPGVALETAGTCGLLSLVPPRVAGPSVPRDLIVLLDTSGSMSGRPIEQAKALVRALIDSLEEHDQLELSSFASQPRRWNRGAVRMTPRNKASARSWLEGERASGCTQMHDAILEALAPLRPDAQRQVLLVSDGLIGFEERIVAAIRQRLPTGCRVHTMGVGSGVNRALTGPAARAGGGVEVVVGLDEGVDEAVRTVLARTRQPQVVDLRLSGSALVDVAPARLPDLFAEAPSRVSLKLRPGVLRVEGRTAEGPWEHELRVEDRAGRRVVQTRWAREKVEDLEAAIAAGEPREALDAEIEALGLAHGIATRLTSWFAATTDPTVDAGQPTRSVTMPHELAYGLSAEGLGLRSQAAAFAGSGPPVGAAFVACAASPPPVAHPAPRAGAARAGTSRFQADMSERFGGPKGGRVGGPPADREDEERSIVRSSSEDSSPYADELLAPSRPIPARVVLFGDGRLVIEFEAPRHLLWDPSALHTLPGTTAPGPVTRGLTVRLVLQWPADDVPRHLAVGDLVLWLRQARGRR